MNLALSGQNVAVLEDEPVMRDLVVQGLSACGLRAVSLPCRQGLFDHVKGGQCVAVVLDLGLPGDDGIAVARDLRRISTVPILMLTGRSGVQDRVTGLEAGADDYLVKPFALEELAARVRALLRRSGAHLVNGVTTAIRLGSVRLDLRTRALEGPAGQARVTECESRILQLLARATGPVPRDTMLRDALNRTWEPDDRSLDVHLANLRR